MHDEQPMLRRPVVLFDAVIIAVSRSGATMLLTQAAAVGFVHDAFAHLKVIGHSIDAMPLLQKAAVVVGPGLLTLSVDSVANFFSQAEKGRIWEREPSVRPVA